jgi:hypothetical protein
MIVNTCLQRGTLAGHPCRAQRRRRQMADEFLSAADFLHGELVRRRWGFYHQSLRIRRQFRAFLCNPWTRSR